MTRQLPLDLPHAPSLAREDLVVTDANRLAVGALDTWPDWPHPVVIAVGPEGSGKTHLASAFAALAGARLVGPGEAGALVAGAPFAAAVDDIDSGAIPEGELFALLNAARLGGGTVFATARRMPAAMRLSLPDLASRLRAATVVPIGAPDDALLAGVLAKLFSDRQLLVDERQIAFLAARCERSLAACARLVEAVDREALAAKGAVTGPLLRRVLASALDKAGGAGQIAQGEDAPAPLDRGRSDGDGDGDGENGGV